MKRSFSIVCMVAFAMTALSAPAFAAQAEPPSAPLPAGSAPPAGPVKIAVIAFRAAVLQTNEGRRDLAQLQAKYAPKEAALKSQNDEIQSLKTQLQNAGSSLSAADQASRERDISDKTARLQRDAEDDQNDENSDMGDMYNSLAQKVYAVLQTYAQEHEYTLVLDDTVEQNVQSTVLWASPAADITRAVIEAYNKKSGVQPPPAAPAATHATPRSTTRPAGSRSRSTSNPK